MSILNKFFCGLGLANVWARFVGARLANSLQRTKGMTYRVISVEEDDESLEFMRVFSLMKPEL